MFRCSGQIRFIRRGGTNSDLVLAASHICWKWPSLLLFPSPTSSRPHTPSWCVGQMRFRSSHLIKPMSPPSHGAPFFPQPTTAGYFKRKFQPTNLFFVDFFSDFFSCLPPSCATRVGGHNHNPKGIYKFFRPLNFMQTLRNESITGEDFTV